MIRIADVSSSPVTTPSPSTTNTDGTSSSSSSTTTGTTNDSLTSEDTFLKLLVAQIQNQDPLNPTDPTQFVGQLTQYSELEQLIQINSGIQTLSGGSSSASGGGDSGSGSGSAGSSGSSNSSGAASGSTSEGNPFAPGATVPKQTN